MTSTLIQPGTLVSHGTNADEAPKEPSPSKSKPPRPKAASQADWKKWFLSDANEPPPDLYPKKAVSNALAKWPGKSIDKATNRAIWGAKEFLIESRAPKRAAAGWLEAVARILFRWYECTKEDFASMPVGVVLAGLTGIAGYDKTTQDLLLKASIPLLGRQSRSELDLLVDALLPDERVQFIQGMIVQSAAGEAPKVGVLNYLNSSPHPESFAPPHRLKLLTLGAILLAEGQEPVISQASSELAEAIDGSASGRLAPNMQRWLESSREQYAGLLSQMESQRQSYQSNLDRERHEKERLRREFENKQRELDTARREQERLREQVRTFRATMASRREESRLEVRRGMLLAIGDILQRACWQGRNSEERLDDVIATLPKALHEGGAEVYGTVGETVPYDPVLHHSTAGMSQGTLVQLAAPGVIVRSSESRNRVILKANVVEKSEAI